MIPTIETIRLVLRPFSVADVDPLYAILQEPGILKYFPRPDPPSMEQVHQMVAKQISYWEAHRLGWWAVAPKATGALAGWCGLQYLAETNEVEVAYLLSQAWWGKGLATEAARASLAYGFDQLGLDSIICLVDPANVRSNRVAQKLEMTLLGQEIYFGMVMNKYRRNRLKLGDSDLE
jgi:RimJ/RimL family protein N-acetyltransferase